ncbi:MAG: SsrA-binding protein SmpB [Actinomycetota bacterium]|nr:SsrA-binding protein SmpB [Actinomycetota bacterium]
MKVEKVVATNRKAYHDFYIDESYEAGIELKGAEVKSIRAGRINLKDSYARVENGELWVFNMHISPYAYADRFAQFEPTRPRKLLLHKKEILRLIGKVKEKGYTLVPLKVYFNSRGKVKVEIGLARGKRLFDKRKAIAERAAKREIERALRERQKGE